MCHNAAKHIFKSYNTMAKKYAQVGVDIINFLTDKFESYSKI